MIKKVPATLQDRILDRFRRRGAGTVLTARDLEDLGAADAVRQALGRGARSGQLTKVARGFYAVPRVDSELGELPARVDAVVEALRSRDGLRLLPSGAHSANLLGLSTQVPIRLVFLTDGPSRRIRVGKQEIVLKQTTPRQMATADKISGTVIQALRWLGRDNVDGKVVSHLRQRLSAREKRELVRDVRLAPAWVREVLLEVAERQSRQG